MSACRARAIASLTPSTSRSAACSKPSMRASRESLDKGLHLRLLSPRNNDTNARLGTSMDATELRALQAPLKDKYKSEPGAARITLKAKGAVDEQSIACKIDTGRALAVAGLHPATGGTGLELCSGDLLLEALVACAGVTI